MKVRLLHILLFLVAWTTSMVAQVTGTSWWNTDYNTTEGTEFWVTFMRNSTGSETDGVKKMKFYIFVTTSYDNTEVTIQNPLTNFNTKVFLNAGERQQIQIPAEQAYLEMDGVTYSRGLCVTSNNPISVYATSHHNSGKYDGTNVLPINALMNSYLVQTYIVDDGATEFAIIAGETQNIDIQIKKTILNQDTFQLSDKPLSDTVSVTLSDINLSLEKGQAYLYRDTINLYTDLSGTKICSSGPLALIVGGQDAVNSTSSNHIFHQATPVDQLGKTFIVTPTVHVENNVEIIDIVRISAVEDNTIICRNDTPLTTINKLETFQDTIISTSDISVVTYTCSKAAACYLYATDQNYIGGNNNKNKNQAAPTLTSITPQEYAIKSVTFTTLGVRTGMKHFVGIVTPTSEVDGMQLDGSSIADKFVSVPNNSNYSYAIINITDTTHRLENINAGVNSTFTARVYGMFRTNKGAESYAYSAGSRVARSADMLINGKYVREEDICIDDEVKFTPIINYDFHNYYWKFIGPNQEVITTPSQYVEQDHFQKFPLADDWEVNLVIERRNPLCENVPPIIDTVKGLIHVHDTAHYVWGHSDTDDMDVCYGDSFYVHYNRGLRYDYVADTVTEQDIYGRLTTFELNKPYVFRDTLETVHGCDSIITQIVYIRPEHDTLLYDTICVNHLPYRTTLYDTQDFASGKEIVIDLSNEDKDKLIGRQIGKYIKPLPIDTTIFLQTIYGCDSVINLHLEVLPIYSIPEYREECKDSLNSYKWDGHTDEHGHPLPGHKIYRKEENGNLVRLLPSDVIPLYPLQTYVYYDSLQTHGCKICDDAPGCDSVHILTLKIKDQLKKVERRTLCDNESFVWRDSLYVGVNYNNEIPYPYSDNGKWRRLLTDKLLEIVLPSTDAGVCDSICTMIVEWCPTFNPKTKEIHICENETYEYTPRYPETHPHDKIYSWTCSVNADGTKNVDIYNLIDTVETINKCNGNRGCDSIVHHIVYVHPTYLDTISVTECQSHTSTYKWTEITETSIWDKQRNKHISPNDIPLNEAGDFIYVDSTKTKTCTDCRNGIGCDSVIVLKLHVNPIFDTIESKPLCENDTLHWRGKTYVGGKAADAIAAGATKRYWATPIPNPNEAEDTYRLPSTYEEIDHKWNGNKYTDSIHFTTKDGCDSIYWLELTVYPSYEIHDTLHVCDNKSIDWEGKTYAGSKFEGAADYNYATSDNWYTDTRSFLIGNACDSIRILHLKVHPSYDSVYVDSVCQDYPYVWDKHMNRILYDSIQQRDIFFSDSIPASEPGWHTYVDKLSTTTCAECEDGSCDSIWTLRLYVKPTVVHTENITICPEQLPYPYGSNGKVATQAGTYQDTIYRSLEYGCNSITTYVITVSEENRSVFHVTICNNELPYNYDYGSTPTANLHFTNLTQSDTYYDTIRIAGMCNHILELHLTINDTTRTDTTYYLCEGDTYVDKDFTDITATRDTSYVKRLERANSVGCDSVVYVTVKFGSTHTVQDADVILCERDSSYTWHTQDTYGTYSQTIKWSDLHETVLDTVLYQTLHTMSPFYCDSVTSVRIQVKPTIYNEYYKTICPTEVPFSDWGNRDEAVSVDGTYTHYIVGGSLRYGCDSIEIMHLTISDSIVTHLDTTICNNELPYNHISSDVTPNLMGLTTTGIYRQILTSASGCDSTIVLHLTVNDTTVLDTTYYLCEGDTYVDKDFTDIIATRDTSYVKRLERANSVGCDSVVYVTVRFGATHTVQDADVILCERDSSYTWHTQDTYGTYSQTIKWSDLHETVLDTVLYQTLHTMSPFYCDSVTSVRIQVKPTVYNEYTKTICPTEVPFSEWGNRDEPVSVDGTYTHYIIGGSLRYGCDSIEIMHLTISDSIVTHLDTTICNNELPYNHISSDVTPNLMGLTTTGIYRQILTSASGCDSTIVLHLTVNDTTVLDTTYYLCEGDTYVDKDFTDITATRDTSYVKRLERSNSVGCDSVVYVTVKFGSTHDVHDADVILCERDSFYTWQTQDTYGTYSQTIKWSDLHETVLDTVLYQTLHTMSPFYCDSVTSVRIQVKPTVYNEYTKTICPTEVPFSDWGNRDEAVSVDGTYTHYIVGGSLRYGCDSIEIMHLTISDSIVTHLDTTICNNELPYNHISSDVTPNLMGLTTTGIYRQILTSASGCDSTIVLHLTVNDTTVLDTTYYLCEGDTYVDKDFTDIIATRDTSYVKRLERSNSVGCDSVVYVTVKFGSTHDVHDADVILCERDSFYTWQTQDTYGTYSQTIKWSDLHETVLDTVLYQTLHTMSPFYCDSVTSVRIQVKPTVYNEYTKTICPTEVPFSDWGNRDEPVSVDGTYTHYIIGGSLRYGCDSIEIMHLTIRDSIVTHLYDSICDNHLPYNHWDTRADNLLNLTHTGVYSDTLTSKLTGCDSIVVLHLQVNKTYNTTQTITICASEGSPYIWRPSDIKGPREIAIPFEIDNRVNVKDKQTLVLNDSSVLLQSVYGCDSLVNLRLIVHPTYELVEVDTVDCQDTINRYSTWTDQLGGVHQIDISEAGWISIAENPGTIYGCDSIIGIKLYVRPTYRYDSVYTICQDERITWQGKTYAGSHYGYNYQMLSDGKYAEHRDSVYYLYELGDSILEAGVHHDTIVYPTILGCDSTFYLTLNVLPTSNTILDVSVCDSEGEYVFKTSDKNGTYYDTIPIFPITEMIDSVRKDTAFHMRQRTLKTPDGCDSTVYLHLTVTPTYEYITRAEICKNDTFTWRENGYDKAGIYYDRRITEQGCDSNFILELFVRPVLYIPKTLHACDNQTVMHSDTLWYDPDSVRFAVETSLLWKPGMEIPKPDDKPRELHYYTLDGRCDSIIYQYYLHIHPTYDFIANATICSNESYQLHDSFIYTPAVAYHEPGSSPAVIDTLITDKLKTVTCEECEGKGCDSIFSANIRILPAYKHIDSVTICSNEKYNWQDTILYEPQGDTTITYFYQKSYTTKLGCDSIYELHLTVHQAYDHDVFDTICSDEYYHFGDTLLNQTGVYLDTLRTIHDCDSIVHLFLTVLDTTIVITYDTICVTEKYRFFDAIYTEPGSYDTITLNDWGCKQYNYLHLAVIDTTVYNISIGDVLCADDEELWVEYEWISGRRLIEYSVFFDEFGHSQGFEDIIHAPLDPTLSYFAIPIPRGEDLPKPPHAYFDSQQGVNSFINETKQNYPEPNRYTMRVVMHNGICGDSLQRKDTTISFWYPSWIHEQHWNDVIVLYRDTFNGGYQFSNYQWYQNGQPLPGATGEYLYLPEQLLMNQRGDCSNYYQVELTRLSDGYTTMTCPICPVLMKDTIVPQDTYFSVVPTLVPKANPVIHFLASHAGTYTITTLMGNTIVSGEFTPDANNYAGNVDLRDYISATNTILNVKLTLNTGETRTIKVMIGN